MNNHSMVQSVVWAILVSLTLSSELLAWECHHCGKNNSVTTEECQRCGTPRKEKLAVPNATFAKQPYLGEGESVSLASGADVRPVEKDQSQEMDTEQPNNVMPVGILHLSQLLISVLRVIDVPSLRAAVGYNSFGVYLSELEAQDTWIDYSIPFFKALYDLSDTIIWPENPNTPGQTDQVIINTEQMVLAALRGTVYNQMNPDEFSLSQVYTMAIQAAAGVDHDNLINDYQQSIQSLDLTGLNADDAIEVLETVLSATQAIIEIQLVQATTNVGECDGDYQENIYMTILVNSSADNAPTYTWIVGFTGEASVGWGNVKKAIRNIKEKPQNKQATCTIS